MPDPISVPAGGVTPMPTLLGVPYDASSSFEPGAAQGPAAIRQALRRASSNSWAEAGIDVLAGDVLDDAGDVDPGDGAAGRDRITRAVAALLERGALPLVLGGDHSITYPVVRAIHARHSNLAIL